MNQPVLPVLPFALSPLLDTAEAHRRLLLLHPTPSGTAWRVVKARERVESERARLEERDRCGFAAEEWEALCAAPLGVFRLLAGEAQARRALEGVLEEGQCSRSPMMGRVCGEALRRLEAGEREGAAVEVEALGALCRQVDARLGLGEGERLRRCLLAVAWRGALAASGWRGLLGRVAPERRQALETLAAALR